MCSAGWLVTPAAGVTRDCHQYLSTTIIIKNFAEARCVCPLPRTSALSGMMRSNVGQGLSSGSELGYSGGLSLQSSNQHITIHALAQLINQRQQHQPPLR
jgi:hypothetical protein